MAHETPAGNARAETGLPFAEREAADLSPLIFHASLRIRVIDNSSFGAAGAVKDKLVFPVILAVFHTQGNYTPDPRMNTMRGSGNYPTKYRKVQIDMPTSRTGMIFSMPCMRTAGSHAAA